MLRYFILLVVLFGILALVALQLREYTPRSFAAISELSVDGNAEIIQAAADGMYLVHTNSKRNSIDIVDLTDPTTPQTITSLGMPGEPTSVGVSQDGKWALAVVYSSQSKPGKSPIDQRLPGVLALIDLREPTNASVTTLMGIGHHPDSIAVTSSGNDLLAIIAIENKPVIVVDGKVTDDDSPGNINDISNAGSIQIVAINPDKPNQYSVTTLSLDETLLSNALMLHVNDPQPEYVALSPGKHLAAVSLQENNGIVIVDPVAAEIVGAFNLGSVSERPADLLDDDKVMLEQRYPTDVSDQPLAGTRFPDAISFTPDGQYLLSADEGAFALTGGRGFSVWTLSGEFVWDDGGEIERQASKMGLYPDKRSDAKGIEIEGITAARFGTRDYAFAVSERGSFVAIYDVTNPLAPKFIQILPTGKGPEGIVAIPERNLLVVAAEKSGTLTIFGHIADSE
jgi:DNA-binding beta-propeller fold protein YncE